MKQDIRLLGGVMLKAQDLYYNQYKIDIENVLTVSSLAMRIFRMWYYDHNKWSIHIPSVNEDKFIRHGYYGGRSECFIPYGNDLYYYDVNSLYPYIMLSCDMPGGKPVWEGNLENRELSELYGFIEAYVECPDTISRPFLPYRSKEGMLLYPTGKFVGIYFSEELIYARNMGYNIIPLRGYLFEKKTSPFKEYVSDLFEKRMEAKKAGKEGMAYVIKMLMNSLYGRFGINPDLNISEICNKLRKDYLVDNARILNVTRLNDENSHVSYIYSEDSKTQKWSPPRIAAVQLSAAVTAYARIHMFPHINRDDCYYTDTDSVVLGNPLSEEFVSSSILGKFKLEEELIKEGIFLAPKSYYLKCLNKGVIKHKGPAKGIVSYEWFLSQYLNPDQSQIVETLNKFRIDWDTLNLGPKNIKINLKIDIGLKRIPVYDKDNRWVGSLPKKVIDYGIDEVNVLRIQMKKLEDKIKHLMNYKADLPEEAVMSPGTDPSMGIEHPTEAKKPKAKKPMDKKENGTKPKDNRKKPKDKKPP
ncbi:hypothetical protein LguiB_036035 [Lonicera macranthoides]